MKEDWGRLLAALISSLRDFQLAEDCLADAFTSALEHWRRGVPDNPQGWLLQTARRRAIDRIRRARNFDRKTPDLALLMEMDRADSEEEAAHEIPDERLRLIFTACHPSLDQKTQVALTLRTLCGLSTVEIARAFLDRDDAMAQRLVRARQKISKAGISYAVPGPEDWEVRLNAVLRVIYLIFNEGHLARLSLVEEAMRLADLLNKLQPGDAEILGLVALMQLTHARSGASLGADGVLVSLDAQDRGLWDQGAMEEGRRLIEKTLRLGRPGPFQLQAAIAAIHSEADRFEETRWHEIVLIYGRLLELSANPVVDLNRAVALSYAAGPEVALKAIAGLEDVLGRYPSYHAAKADFLKRSGAVSQALVSFQTAIGLSDREADKLFLVRKFDQAKKEAEQSSAQVQQGG